MVIEKSKRIGDCRFTVEKHTLTNVWFSYTIRPSWINTKIMDS